jgi:hypothetical protein
MAPRHLIGELVICDPFAGRPKFGLVICATKANRDPLAAGSARSDRYPWVYYVLTCSGISGPLFSSELSHVSDAPAW